MILGLAGPKQVGKNTVANFIKEEFSNALDIHEHSFAAKLKQSAAASLGQHYDTLEEALVFCDELKEKGQIVVNISRPYPDGLCTFQFSGREFLQWYGTEAHRDIFGQQFWVSQVLDRIPERDIQNRLDIITDVRFKNEAHAIREEAPTKGIIARVIRPEMENSGDEHASEQPLPQNLVDHEILNDGSLDDLRLTVINFVQKGIINE